MFGYVVITQKDYDSFGVLLVVCPLSVRPSVRLTLVFRFLFLSLRTKPQEHENLNLACTQVSYP